MTEEELTTVSWHGGLYFDKKRTPWEEISKQLKQGQTIELYQFLEDPKDIAVTQDTIIYEDDDYLIANKPAWLPIQGTRVSTKFSLEEKLKSLTANPKLTAAHRLDRQTSGLVIFSHHSKANAHISKQFVDKTLSKTYHAITEKNDNHDLDWTVEGYLRRNFRLSPKVVFFLEKTQKKKAKWSQTHFKVLHTDEHNSYIQANPITGRTHQIRIHLAKSYNPILGDVQYGAKKQQELSRFQLHAYSIRFETLKGISLEICAPHTHDFLWKK